MYTSTRGSRSQELGYSGKFNQVGAAPLDEADYNKWLDTLEDWQRDYLSRGWSDEYQFMNDIQQYRSDPYVYQQLLDSFNNYNHQVFEPNAIQSLAEQLLHDTSARQNFANQRWANLMDAKQRILEGKHTEDVSSEVSQVARARSAGLNPDLNGGSSIEPMTPGNIDQTEASPFTSNSGESAVSEIASVGVNLIQTAISVYSSFKGIQGMDIDNELKSIELGSSVTNELWNIISDSTGEYINNELKYIPGSTAEVLQKDGKFYSHVSQAVKDRIKDLPYSHRTKQRYYNMIDKLIYAFDDEGTSNFTARYESLVNNLLTGLSNSRSEFTKAYGSIGADQGSQMAMRFLSTKIYKPLNEELIRLQELETKYKIRATEKGLQIGLPEEEVSTSYAELAFKKEMKKVADRITKSFERINNAIINDSSLTPTWKVALQTAVAGTEGLVFSKLKF